MEKLSLYEFLAFLLPGVCMNYILGWMFQILNINYISFENKDSFLLGFSLALISGLIIHRVTFLLIERCSGYKFFLMKPIESYTTAKSIKSSVKYLKNQYPNKTPGKLFDKAYYYLESQDKIEPAKMFQSIYFFLRNMVLVYLVSFIILLPVCIMYCDRKELWIYLLLDTGLCITTLLIQDFYRMKMVERVFNTYMSLLKQK